MKRVLLLTALVAAVAASTAAAETRKLSRAEVDELLAQPDTVLIVDVRRPDELTSIGGFAVYLSIQSDAIEQHLKEIPRDRRIITVSNHASRATRAADLLSKHGFTVAGAVGAQDYEAAGGRLVKIAPKAPSSNAAR